MDGCLVGRPTKETTSHRRLSTVDYRLFIDCQSIRSEETNGLALGAARAIQSANQETGPLD